VRNKILGSASAIAIVLAGGGVASAADLPVKTPYAAPPSLFNWSGWYIGGSIERSAARLPSDSDPVNSIGRAVIPGMHLGYNVQNGNIVWGLEGNVNFTKATHVIGSPNQLVKIDNTASVRARLGWAVDRVLFYGTAGVGYMKIRATTSDPAGASVFSGNAWRPVVGFGIEGALTNNWILGGEYLAYLGSKNVTGGALADDSRQLKNVEEFRLRLSYKFDGSGWGKGPVAANTSAGLPVKAAPYAGRVFNWSGWYLGGSIERSAARIPSSEIQSGVNVTDPVNSVGRAVIPGMHLGYNVQNGNIVWGLEGNINFTRANHIIGSPTQLVKLDNTASVRARLGWAVDNVLFYGTGGAGYMKIRATTSAGGSSFSGHAWRPVVGFGVEGALTNNWILGAEYLVYLGSTNISGSGDDDRFVKNVEEFRLKLTYKFDGSGWGKGPVVAKY